MNYKHDLIVYRTITPLHVGCGQAVGVVDLPLIRERATGYPFIPGSSIRGSLRAFFDTEAPGLVKSLFGPGTDGEIDHAGCLSIHDARLLFYPVRSDKHVFLWVTSPLALSRFNRDIGAFQVTGLTPCNESVLTAIAGKDGAFIGLTNEEGQVHCEEFLLERLQNENIDHSQIETFAAQFARVGSDFASRVILISDRSFFHFVNYATMLTQHNELTTTKTVKDGALFSIESLPPETIFYGMIGTTNERTPQNADSDLDRLLQQCVRLQFKQAAFGADGVNYFHLGGRESTGLGVTQLSWMGGD